MAKTLSSLGKGLDSILGDDDSDYIASQVPINEENKNFRKIPLDKIDANPDQPRQEFEPIALAELVDSIRANGVLQPILVERRPLNRFLIIAGERRYRASKTAGLTDIPAVIKEDLSEKKVLELALIENIQRENLTPIEEALAYKKLMESHAMNQEEVAQLVGKNRASVANSIRLLKLPQEIQLAVNLGQITFGHARALLSVINPSDQKLLFFQMIENSISVREAERLSQVYNNGKKGVAENQKPLSQSMPTLLDPQLAHIQEKIMTFLGTKITIKGSLEKGKIEIDYYSGDDLHRLYDLLIKQK